MGSSAGGHLAARVSTGFDIRSYEEVDELAESIRQGLEWDGPCFQISAFQKQNTEELCKEIMNYLDTLPSELAEEQDDEQEFQWDSYEKNVTPDPVDDFDDDDDDWDDDDYDVEVIYTNE